MTIEEYIKTLPDAELILAYIACAGTEDIDVGEDLRDLDIENDEYEDFSDETEELVEQARDRAIADYPINSKEEALRYFDECYGDDLEDDEELQEWREKWQVLFFQRKIFLNRTLDVKFVDTVRQKWTSSWMM